MILTPLHLEILIAAHTITNYSPVSPAGKEYTEELIAAGLIAVAGKDINEGFDGKYYQLTRRGDRFFRLILATPLPVVQFGYWVDPRDNGDLFVEGNK